MVNKLVIGGVAIAIVLSLVAVARPAQNTETIKYLQDGTPVVGSVPTLDGVENPNFNINGYAGAFKSFGTASSSVPCSIQNPTGSTSTVEAIYVRLTNSTGAAQVFDIATSTSLYATTTPGGTLVRGANINAAGSTFTAWFANSATTTSNLAKQFNSVTGESLMVLAPTEKIIVKVATATPGNALVTGYCSAKFQKI